MDIVITDLTRFNNKDIVCIAGLCRETGVCVRPLPYLKYEDVKRYKILPGSVLSGTFSRQSGATPPHVEDFDWSNGQQGPQVSGEEFEGLLAKSAFAGVRAGFGALPDSKVFAVPPPRSIITVKLDDPSSQISVGIDNYGKMKCHFTDAEGNSFSWVPITDLGFHNYLSSLNNADGNLAQLTSFIEKQSAVYLRVGLSRLYEAGNRKGFWMQLNGIYTFPLFSEGVRSYE